MKIFQRLASLVFFGQCVTAYPGVMQHVQKANVKRQGVPDLNPTFDASSQLVDITGEHEFQAPDLDAGDQRGPCPGLNAAANHGYLPRNGVGTHLDFITGTHQVFGMGADLAGFLTVLGATVDGNGLAWSIGGPSPALSGVAGLLGQPQGISASHNKYESDVSPGRGDLYQYGDDFTLQMTQYQQLYDMAQTNGDIVDLDLLNSFRSMRFDQSIQNNPYFFNGPFTGLLVQPAAYEFIYRFMGNKSADHPDGRLNTEVMNSFFGITRNADGSLTKNAGMERIPENWYKRAIGDEYTIPFLNSDTLAAATKYPKFLSVGGNLGTVNTFTGVAPEDITGGVFNGATLLEGNNLACFASEFMTQVTPDLLKCSGVLGDITSAMSNLADQVSQSFASLSCPTLNSASTDQFNKFPGYKKLDCKTGAYT